MVQSVETAFRLLELVAESQPVGVSDVARASGIPKSTAQRLLQTLASLGWLRSVNTDGSRSDVKWILTNHVLAVSGRVPHEANLRDAAHDVIRELADETGETIHLSMPDARHIVLIDRIPSRHAVHTVSWVGMRAPIHATASGRCVLARMSEERIRALLGPSLEKTTEATVTDYRQMFEKLEAIRRQGYAVNRGEWRLEVCAVGAAVGPSRAGEATGSVSISVPAHRLPDSTCRSYGELVVEAAARISGRLRKSLA